MDKEAIASIVVKTIRCLPLEGLCNINNAVCTTDQWILDHQLLKELLSSMKDDCRCCVGIYTRLVQALADSDSMRAITTRDATAPLGAS